jgi:hypothetical protein
VAAVPGRAAVKQSVLPRLALLVTDWQGAGLIDSLPALPRFFGTKPALRMGANCLSGPFRQLDRQLSGRAAARSGCSSRACSTLRCAGHA